jgi:hypothetical protein
MPSLFTQLFEESRRLIVAARSFMLPPAGGAYMRVATPAARKRLAE